MWTTSLSVLQKNTKAVNYYPPSSTDLSIVHSQSLAVLNDMYTFNKVPVQIQNFFIVLFVLPLLVGGLLFDRFGSNDSLHTISLGCGSTKFVFCFRLIVFLVSFVSLSVVVSPILIDWRGFSSQDIQQTVAHKFNLSIQKPISQNVTQRTNQIWVGTLQFNEPLGDCLQMLPHTVSWSAGAWTKHVWPWKAYHMTLNLLCFVTFNPGGILTTGTFLRFCFCTNALTVSGGMNAASYSVSKNGGTGAL